MRAEHNLLCLRSADGALFKPARIHHACGCAPVAQQHTLPGERVRNQVVEIRFHLRRQDGNDVFNQIIDTAFRRRILSGVGRQGHARLEDVFIDFARIGHAVDGHQGGDKRAAAEFADDDIRVARRAEAVAEHADVARQIRAERNGIVLHEYASMRVFGR